MVERTRHNVTLYARTLPSLFDLLLYYYITVLIYVNNITDVVDALLLLASSLLLLLLLLVNSCITQPVCYLTRDLSTSLLCVCVRGLLLDVFSRMFDSRLCNWMFGCCANTLTIKKCTELLQYYYYY
jgi:hypothetical protein